MIDDFRPIRDKPKRIEPLEKPTQKPITDLAAEHDALKAAATEATEEPIFQPPEVVAASDEQPSKTPSEVQAAIPAQPEQNASSKGFMSWRWPLNRKWTVIMSIVGVLVIAGGIAAAYHLTRSDVTGGTHKSARGKYVPKVTTVASKLTGLPVDPSVNERPVTGVMIENSAEARPQSGLSDAGVVFEAIAEGGITRFLALFQDTQPDYIGPVRSARPYYVQWCMGFDCALAHVGGSPEALADIKAWGTKNLDQFANGGAYQRISTRYAPHNVYTSIAKLSALEASKGYGAATYTGFTRKKDSASKTPNASSISFAISSGLYNAHFDYDATTNSYKRSQAGAAHMNVDSAGNQTQINPKVVIAMVMQYGLEADDHHSQYTVIGSGQAYIFQDGTVTQATWSKADTKAPLRFVDAAGKDIPLNAGRTWLTALATPNLVTYQ